MEQLGKYGFLRRDYLKNHKNSLYQVMLLQDTIGKHLLEVDKEAREREEVILKHKTISRRFLFSAYNRRSRIFEVPIWHLKNTRARKKRVDDVIFVEMRRFIANNALLFERISNVELKQLEYQKKTDEKLEQIFEYISDHEESNQKIFFDGQIYDAFSLLIGLIQKAETEIVLVDGYVDVGTLNILSKKKENVAVTVYTLQWTKLSQTDVDNFNAQYPKLDVKYTRAFHDRFLILDKTKAYHVGASLKDAGKKCFGINLIEDAGIVRDILQRLELETEE